MSAQWYQIALCKPCASGSGARCTEPECALWMRVQGMPLGNEFNLVQLTRDQVMALDAAREFDRGLQLEN